MAKIGGFSRDCFRIVARIIEQRIEHELHALRPPADPHHDFLALVVQLVVVVFTKRVDESVDPLQRSAQIMRDDRGELLQPAVRRR